MGRHRSSLRDLGWGVSNSPNPWKQGSAKRVVRTLDYSQAELDEPTTELPSALEAQQAAGGGLKLELDDKLAQLQQDGRQQLDRIREQFEQQEAESKRKLERLNGCAAAHRAVLALSLGVRCCSSHAANPMPRPSAIAAALHTRLPTAAVCRCSQAYRGAR